MNIYSKLKAIWKKFGVNGQVKNYSDVDLWVLETDTAGIPIARIIVPGYKTPSNVDCDAFKRKDGKSIQGHNNWWKFYDFSTVDIYKYGKGLRVSVVSKTAVDENHFKIVTYKKEKWGAPLTVIIDVKRDRRNKIVAYHVSGHGWLDFESTFRMTCHHEIDNARPVFPKNGKPYIRSKRDKFILNNFNNKGRV